MPTNVQPERLELLNFFQRLPNTQFVIPVYQRNYIWNAKKEVKKYLEDYKEILDGQRTKHFIGIIMYLKIERSIGFYEYSVVDGQQRLVTTFLILYALKKIALENRNENFANQVTAQYLTNQFAVDDNDKLKLKPLISDDNVFSKIIRDDLNNLSKEEKKSNVYLNYKYIYEFVKTCYGRHSIEEILNALNGFYFVAIPLDSNSDDAQKIFETINSAGAALSKADLIRNYILMNVENDRQDYYYKNYWYKLEKLFENSNKLENYFRLFLANRTFSLSNLEDVYDEFQKWYDGYRKDHSIEDALKLIYNYAIYYCDLFVNNTESLEIDNCVKESLSEFKKNSVEPTAPLLMEIYSLYKTGNDFSDHLVSANDFSKIIQLFNIYTVRRNICNQRTGILTRIVPLMLKSILDSCSGNYRNIYDYCVRYLVDNGKGKQSFMPDDEYMKSNLIGLNAYALRNYVKIVFEKIESHNNPAIVDFSGLSIEHLMPQTPTEEWLNRLNVNKEVYEYNLHRLGNLTLAAVHDNIVMSNKPFEFKREILSSTSHIKMNKEILDLEKWDIEEIENRTIKLIDKICELYPYVSVGDSLVESYNIYLKNDNNEVHARIFKDHVVEIQEDSKFSCLFSSKIQKLMEDDIIREIHGRYVFVLPYTFENIYNATEFIIPGNNDNVWELWVDSDGHPLSIDVRVKLENN